MLKKLNISPEFRRTLNSIEIDRIVSEKSRKQRIFCNNVNILNCFVICMRLIFSASLRNLCCLVENRNLLLKKYDERIWSKRKAHLQNTNTREENVVQSENIKYQLREW